MTHLKYHPGKAHTSTVALADRVAELREGGERLLEAAKLRKADVPWWPRCLKGIEDAIRAEAVAIATPDAELIAKIPEESYKVALAGAYGQREKDATRAKVQEAYLRDARHGKPWMLYVVYLDRDADRLLHEGIHMGPAVLKARSQIHAFAAAVAVVTGCASLVEETRFEEFEESEGA